MPLPGCNPSNRADCLCEVNKSGDFVHCGPGERRGHKWRLKSLWKELAAAGVGPTECGRAWRNIRDLVVKENGTNFK